MKHTLSFFFLLLLGACSSSPNASTSSAGAGGAAGDSMSNLFGGRGGTSGSVTLLEDGAVVSADDGSVSPDGGFVSGADGSVSQDGGIVSPDAGLDAGADAGVALDPECEGIKFPEPGCRCAGFEAHAFFFCPGPLDKSGAVTSCAGVSGLVLIGNIDLPNQNPVKYNFIRDWSGEVVWMLGTLSSSTPPYTMLCNVLTADSTMSADCSESHAYVCEEQL